MVVFYTLWQDYFGCFSKEIREFLKVLLRDFLYEIWFIRGDKIYNFFLVVILSYQVLDVCRFSQISVLLFKDQFNVSLLELISFLADIRVKFYKPLVPNNKLVVVCQRYVKYNRDLSSFEVKYNGSSLKLNSVLIKLVSVKYLEVIWFFYFYNR